MFRTKILIPFIILFISIQVDTKPHNCFCDMRAVGVNFSIELERKNPELAINQIIMKLVDRYNQLADKFVQVETKEKKIYPKLELVQLKSVYNTSINSNVKSDPLAIGKASPTFNKYRDLEMTFFVNPQSGTQGNKESFTVTYGGRNLFKTQYNPQASETNPEKRKSTVQTGKRASTKKRPSQINSSSSPSGVPIFEKYVVKFKKNEQDFAEIKDKVDSAKVRVSRNVQQTPSKRQSQVQNKRESTRKPPTPSKLQMDQKRQSQIDQAHKLDPKVNIDLFPSRTAYLSTYYIEKFEFILCINFHIFINKLLRAHNIKIFNRKEIVKIPVQRRVEGKRMYHEVEAYISPVDKMAYEEDKRTCKPYTSSTPVTIPYQPIMTDIPKLYALMYLIDFKTPEQKTEFYSKVIADQKWIKFNEMGAAKVNASKQIREKSKQELLKREKGWDNSTQLNRPSRKSIAPNRPSNIGQTPRKSKISSKNIVEHKPQFNNFLQGSSNSKINMIGLQRAFPSGLNAKGPSMFANNLAAEIINQGTELERRKRPTKQIKDLGPSEISIGNPSNLDRPKKEISNNIPKPSVINRQTPRKSSLNVNSGQKTGILSKPVQESKKGLDLNNFGHIDLLGAINKKLGTKNPVPSARNGNQLEAPKDQSQALSIDKKRPFKIRVPKAQNNILIDGSMPNNSNQQPEKDAQQEKLVIKRENINFDKIAKEAQENPSAILTDPKKTIDEKTGIIQPPIDSSLQKGNDGVRKSTIGRKLIINGEHTIKLPFDISNKGIEDLKKMQEKYMNKYELKTGQKYFNPFSDANQANKQPNETEFKTGIDLRPDVLQVIKPNFKDNQEITKPRLFSGPINAIKNGPVHAYAVELDPKVSSIKEQFDDFKKNMIGHNTSSLTTEEEFEKLSEDVTNEFLEETEIFVADGSININPVDDLENYEDEEDEEIIEEGQAKTGQDTFETIKIETSTPKKIRSIKKSKIILRKKSKLSKWKLFKLIRKLRPNGIEKITTPNPKSIDPKTLDLNAVNSKDVVSEMISPFNVPEGKEEKIEIDYHELKKSMVTDNASQIDTMEEDCFICNYHSKKSTCSKSISTSVLQKFTFVSEPKEQNLFIPNENDHCSTLTDEKEKLRCRRRRTYINHLILTLDSYAQDTNNKPTGESANGKEKTVNFNGDQITLIVYDDYRIEITPLAVIPKILPIALEKQGYLIVEYTFTISDLGINMAGDLLESPGELTSTDESQQKKYELYEVVKRIKIKMMILVDKFIFLDFDDFAFPSEMDFNECMKHMEEILMKIKMALKTGDEQIVFDPKPVDELLEKHRPEDMKKLEQQQKQMKNVI